MSSPERAFSARHVQLLRALFAAVAALMITFSADHSAGVGLSVFSGFALVTALVLVLGAWLAVPAGKRMPLILLAVVDGIAGMVAGVPVWRTDDVFFVTVVTWALLSGALEILFAVRARRAADADVTARDGFISGGLGVLLGIALLLIPAGFAVDYTVEGAGSYTLTGIILGVGMLGGYACLLAVHLGIAGFSPRPAVAASVDAEPAGGAA